MRLYWLSALVLTASLSSLSLNAQTATLSGQLKETDGRGALRNVKITVLKNTTQEIFAEGLSAKDGSFSVELPTDIAYRIVAEKKHFFSTDTLLTIPASDSLCNVQLELERKPGYVFDVTISEATHNEANITAVKGARIEVFNNTTGKEELTLNDYPHANFKFNFEKGNHYTLMIRRDGYLNKRIEAYINVEGCILCFDGLGIIDPGVTDVLSNNNDIGTFLANIQLEPALINKTFEIDNIYYDFNKWNIRPDAATELDKLIGVLQDNPAIIVEMGSHTDARGRDAYNMSLSQRRARAAVEYLITKGIKGDRLTWKGYGETQLANHCEDGTVCDENSHQRNRRTELKIVGFQQEDPLEKQSLKDIIARERVMDELSGEDVIQVEKESKKEQKDQEK
ncbi:MAG: OmpA family protein [Bacteroidota bacterium]